MIGWDKLRSDGVPSNPHSAETREDLEGGGRFLVYRNM